MPSSRIPAPAALAGVAEKMSLNVRAGVGDRARGREGREVLSVREAPSPCCANRRRDERGRDARTGDFFGEVALLSGGSGMRPSWRRFCRRLRLEEGDFPQRSPPVRRSTTAARRVLLAALTTIQGPPMATSRCLPRALTTPCARLAPLPDELKFQCEAREHFFSAWRTILAGRQRSSTRSIS